MKNKRKLSKRCSSIVGFPLLLLIFFVSCSKDRIMDRHDERIISYSEDHYNLYNRNRTTELISTKEDYKNIPSFEINECFFQYKNLYEITPIKLASKDFSKGYALISVSWKKSPPVLRFWTRFVNIAKWVDLTIPLNDDNSYIPAESADNPSIIESYNVIVPIRQDSYMPWVVEDDYEIFAVKLTKRKNEEEKEQWIVEEITQLTDDRNNNIQAILSPDKKVIVYVSLKGREKTLIKMNLDGGNPEIIAKNASLPYFVPDTGKLLFVRQTKVIRDFMIYDFNTKKEVPADSAELSAAISSIPYASLKAKYMLMENYMRTSQDNNSGYTLEQLLVKGLKNSPTILKDYYKFEASLSSTTATLYDEGPDWFSSGTVIPKENIYSSPDNPIPIGDRITTEKFIRLITGLSVPIIPNLPLRFARYDSNKCQEEVYRQHLHKTINEYIKNVIIAYYDAVEAEQLLPIYRECIVLNKKRLERNGENVKLGELLTARELFAQNLLAAAESDYNAAVEKLIHTKFAIATLLGEKITRDINLRMPQLNWDVPPIETPKFSFFQAQSQINHPDIQRINAMISKASAIRDMGPPARRVDAVRVNVRYGLGFANWSKMVDDFLQVGITAMIPLRLPILDNAYYDKWKAKIMSMRQEKYVTQAKLKSSVHEAYMDLNTLIYSMNAVDKRFAFLKENYRLNRIYEKIGSLEIHNEDSDKWLLNSPIITKLEMLETKKKLISSKCDFFRRAAKLYAASGISSRFIPAVCRASEPASHTKLPSPKSRSLFLWETKKIVTNKANREEFLEKCSKAGIKRIYCFISRTANKELYLKKYDLEISCFLDQCRKNKIEVYALMGNTGWLEKSCRKEITTLLISLHEFNKMQLSNESSPFTGIKLDIEPHALPAWHTNKQSELVSAYLKTLDFINKNYKGTIAVDIPYTYNKVPVKNSDKDFIAEIAKRVDLISIMAYLDNVKAIRKKTDPIFARKDLPVPIEIALETAPVAEKGISFYGKNYTTFLTVCKDLKNDFSDFSSFAGFAFHDYKYFRLMLNNKNNRRD